MYKIESIEDIISDNFFETVNIKNRQEYRNRLLKLIEDKKKYILTENGNAPKYLKALEEMPSVKPITLDLCSDRIKIGSNSDISKQDRNSLIKSLYKLMPWRKGPYRLFGIDIDSEWESHLKWNRIKDKIAPLKNRRVLDIGSSSGYYMFKMAALKPKIVIGLEPYLTFYFQYKALTRYINLPNIFCIPAKSEEFPIMENYFDSIFCMGILYHARSPVDFLKRINKSLKKGGEIILETLIIEGDDSKAFFPEKRYAQMNNIYFLPTILCLKNWLKRAGFKNIRIVDITKTTVKEQRKTDWVNTQSLEDFLDKDDFNKTVEGYPAPIRAAALANAI
ncbi:MAG: tRNA 5-methoxyuridine(34)/uridine 5-oxyacetic acid(34) synthase CmoB [Deltaproteobacteria bacterium]|nr:tRNA 5-methoxyuridine(34)/uridine 5-oxyacetic acid(34) synthase CmoB [Deltaproteobacteria bacterium]